MAQVCTPDKIATDQLQASLLRVRRIAASLSDPDDRAALEGHILELERELAYRRRRTERIDLE